MEATSILDIIALDLYRPVDAREHYLATTKSYSHRIEWTISRKFESWQAFPDSYIDSQNVGIELTSHGNQYQLPPRPLQKGDVAPSHRILRPQFLLFSSTGAKI
jgi:hypothetical protein